MSQMFSFRMEDDVKQRMETACKALGISMSAAFNLYAVKLGNEFRIPFEVSVDPFYSPANIRYLEALAAEVDNGTAKLTEHDLIEV